MEDGELKANETQEVSKEVEEPKTQETKPEETEEVKPFADKPDLKGRTPEELESIYQDWNKKYTEKRQKETAEVKEWKAKVSEMEQRLSQVEAAGQKIQTPELENKRDEVQKQFDLGNMTVPEYTAYMKELLREEARNIAREEYQNLSTASKDEETQEGAMNDFVSSDDRLNQNAPTFDRFMFKALASEMADLLDEHIKQTGSARGFDSKSYTQKLIQEYDGRYNQEVKNRIKNNNEVVKAQISKFQKITPRGSTQSSQSQEPKSFRDILKDKIDAS